MEGWNRNILTKGEMCINLMHGYFLLNVAEFVHFGLSFVSSMVCKVIFYLLLQSLLTSVFPL